MWVVGDFRLNLRSIYNSRFFTVKHKHQFQAFFLCQCRGMHWSRNEKQIRVTFSGLMETKEER